MSSLTVFCGAEVTSNADADLLVRAATSVQRQTRPTLMWICEHHTDTVDEPRLTAQLATALPANSRHIKSRSTKSVFEHYRVLIDKYVEAHPTCLTTEMYSHWITFVEGEVIIGSGRMQALAKIAEWHRSSWAPQQRSVWAGQTMVQDSVIHVRDVFRLTHSPAHGYHAYYWEYCITARLLHFFMQRTVPAVTRHLWAQHALLGLLHGTSEPRPTRQRRLVRTAYDAEPQSFYTCVALTFPHTPTINPIAFFVLSSVGTHKQLNVNDIVHALPNIVPWLASPTPRRTVKREVNKVVRAIATDIANFKRAPTMDDYIEHLRVQQAARPAADTTAADTASGKMTD